MESIGDAARRLLAKLGEHANRPAGEIPAEIAESTGNVPAVPSRKAAEGSAHNGEDARHLRQQLTVASAGGVCGNGLVLKAANDNGPGHAALAIWRGV